MHTKRLPLSVAITTCLLSHAANATLPEVKVEESNSLLTQQHSADLSRITTPDTASLLRTMPGANINSNGALTGIAQYRGLYGDRVNVSIDGAHIHSGGPNAMDAPLSYIPSSQLKQLSVERGIASVASGQETIGGHISATSDKGRFTDSSDFEVQSQLGSQWQSQNEGRQSSAMVGVANNQHKLGFSTVDEDADNSEFDDGELAATEYQRKRHNVFYGYHDDKQAFNISAGKHNTGLSGTPALGMDIVAIDTDLVNADYQIQVGETTYKASINLSNVYHEMDNFSLRTGTMDAMQRHNTASGDGAMYKLSFSTPFAGGTFEAGIDQSFSTHNSDIINPNNAMFFVNLFNDAERDIFGTYGQWQLEDDKLGVEVGVRYNRVHMDAGTIDTSMTMMAGMMGMNTTTLRDSFNNSDRDQTDNNLDLVLKTSYQLSDQTQLNAGLSRKQRAPSYQERYLWISMPSTGGMADGRNYVGNVELDSETAYELNLGADINFDRGYLGVNTFVRDINDYIQGTAVQGDAAYVMAANMVAQMMMNNGQDALQYNNVDARLIGGEVSYGIALSAQWRLDGVLNYVRGERTDVDDNLYRIAPLNHQLKLSYQQDNWNIAAISELVAEQNKVSSYNSEAATAGYGLLHLQANWQVSPALALNAGIQNVTDKRYTDHLSGYNRVSGSDVGVGERLYGHGRSFNAGVTYHF